MSVAQCCARLRAQLGRIRPVVKIGTKHAVNKRRRDQLYTQHCMLQRSAFYAQPAMVTQTDTGLLTDGYSIWLGWAMRRQWT